MGLDITKVPLPMRSYGLNRIMKRWLSIIIGRDCNLIVACLPGRLSK